MMVVLATSNPLVMEAAAAAACPKKKRKCHEKTKNAENEREMTAPKTHEASRTRVVFGGRG
jgi:hypothetical protein